MPTGPPCAGQDQAKQWRQAPSWQLPRVAVCPPLRACPLGLSIHQSDRVPPPSKAVKVPQGLRPWASSLAKARGVPLPQGARQTFSKC